jgi:hypothetical protein
LRCTFGSQVRRVLCIECGTLFPLWTSWPWKRPSWPRLNGALKGSLDARHDRVGSMAARARVGCRDEDEESRSEDGGAERGKTARAVLGYVWRETFPDLVSSLPSSLEHLLHAKTFAPSFSKHG